jgi:hypothetical protein
VRHDSRISSSLLFGAQEDSDWQLRDTGTNICTLSLEDSLAARSKV